MEHQQIQPQRQPWQSNAHVAIVPKDLVSLSVWCRAEARKTELPLSFTDRWIVAEYQFATAIHWQRGNMCRYQQLAAAIIHLFAMGEMENLQLYTLLEVDMYSYSYTPLEATQDAIANSFCLASQIVFYRSQMHKHRHNPAAKNYYQRAKRRAPYQKFKRNHAKLIQLLLESIPKTHRSEAFHHEMRIMCGDLNS